MPARQVTEALHRAVTCNLRRFRPLRSPKQGKRFFRFESRLDARPADGS